MARKKPAKKAKSRKKPAAKAAAKKVTRKVGAAKPGPRRAEDGCANPPYEPRFTTSPVRSL